MRFVFIHPVFPGQFHRVMEQLASQPGNDVIHISHTAALTDVPGVRRLRYAAPDPGAIKADRIARPFEEAVLHGQAVAKVLRGLQQQGVIPDLIYGYTGFGQTMFVKDIFPSVPLVGYFEWYLNAHGSEYNFDPTFPLQEEHHYFLRAANAPRLLDLEACDYGITPTRWQRHQFPPPLQHKLTVLHDGVDVERFQPKPGAALELAGVRLPAGTPVVTYVTRGMEPFRGFPQFMRALAELQARHPTVHAVIVGTEDVFYSKRLPQGRTYKQELLAELDGRLDLARVHFTGWLDTPDYLAVLQASTAHVYFTRPYVLSWSMLEAMAAGCLVIGSRTAPVEEMIRDGENGLLTDFFDHHALADRLHAVVSGPARFTAMRENARASIVARYDLRELVARHADLLMRWAGSPIASGPRTFVSSEPT